MTCVTKLLPDAEIYDQKLAELLSRLKLNLLYEDSRYVDSLVYFVCAVLACGHRFSFSVSIDLAYSIAI